jgi:hypothetical protein
MGRCWNALTPDDLRVGTGVRKSMREATSGNPQHFPGQQWNDLYKNLIKLPGLLNLHYRMQRGPS